MPPWPAKQLKGQILVSVSVNVPQKERRMKLCIALHIRAIRPYPPLTLLCATITHPPCYSTRVRQLYNVTGVCAMSTMALPSNQGAVAVTLLTSHRTSHTPPDRYELKMRAHYADTISIVST